jgi:hypothetical protein
MHPEFRSRLKSADEARTNEKAKSKVKDARHPQTSRTGGRYETSGWPRHLFYANGEVTNRSRRVKFVAVFVRRRVNPGATRQRFCLREIPRSTTGEPDDDPDQIRN